MRVRIWWLFLAGFCCGFAVCLLVENVTRLAMLGNDHHRSASLQKIACNGQDFIWPDDFEKDRDGKNMRRFSEACLSRKSHE